MAFPVISADSHITEPPDCYTANIDPKYRDRAPHMIADDERGGQVVLERDLVDYFPTPLRDRFRNGILDHRLHREIATTQLLRIICAHHVGTILAITDLENADASAIE